MEVNCFHHQDAIIGAVTYEEIVTGIQKIIWALMQTLILPVPFISIQNHRSILAELNSLIGF